MVLFVTGICSFHCFYCPVSDEKMYKDVVFADEKRVTRDEDVLEEAHAIQATGAGITGGDPLDAVERTCHYIRLLKDEFGPRFHTHLYTMSTDADKIRSLGDAGLDEIRFHVPPGLWSRAHRSAFVAASRLARSLGLTVGLEVPLIPEREADLVRLIEWAGDEGLAFVNLNEMEFSEANFPRMKVHGYEMKHELSYGVKGADPVALRILGRKWRTTVHYCTSGYKDGWQLRSRIKRRAENVAHPWDVITKDGTLLKGIVEGSDLEPLRKVLEGTYHVPPDLMGVDGPRKRLEIAEASPALIPRRGVSDGGRPRGRADPAGVGAQVAHRNPSGGDHRHGPSVPPQFEQMRPRNRPDHPSSRASVPDPSGNPSRRRAVGTWMARIEQREAAAFGSNRSTASERRRSRSAMTARSSS